MADVAIVDYGGGNVRSLRAALERCGATARLASEPADVAGAERLLIAGQGAAGAAMAALAAAGLDEAIRSAAAAGTPLLGVCVGLQILFERSAEDDTRCLGLIPGAVHRLDGAARLPHLGWNDVEPARDHPLTRTLPAVAYFAHSYGVAPSTPATIAVTQVDDDSFASVVAHGSVAGVQFHPERSAEAGRALLRAFLAWDGS